METEHSRQKTLLLVTDLAAVGRAAALCMLPVLNLSGHAVSLLPTAYFSSHTLGFGAVHRLDLAHDMEATLRHWQGQGLRFDAVLVSYMTGARQLELLEENLGSLLAPGGSLYVDPVMGDHGRRYAFCGEELLAGYRRLCAKAEVIFPNRTEAALLLGLPLTEGEEPPVPEAGQLKALGANMVVLTGHTRGADAIGVLLYQRAGDALHETFRRRYPQSYPGTGDLLAAAMVTALLKGKTPEQAAETACDFLDQALAATAHFNAEPRFGLAFEEALPFLARALNLNH